MALKTQTIAFKKAIIAAGSQAVRLPFMPNDPRVVDSTGALGLKEVPKRMLILGGGMVGTNAGDMIGEIALVTVRGRAHLGLHRRLTHSQPRPSLTIRCRPSAQRTSRGRC